MYENKKKVSLSLDALNLPLVLSREVILNGLFSHSAFAWKCPWDSPEKWKERKSEGKCRIFMAPFYHINPFPLIRQLRQIKL